MEIMTSPLSELLNIVVLDFLLQLSLLGGTRLILGDVLSRETFVFDIEICRQICL